MKMARHFEHKRVWLLDQYLYEQSFNLLLPEFEGLDFRPVIGIARGGCQLGRDLAKALQLPYYNIRARHNCSDELYSKMGPSVQVDLDEIKGVIQYPKVLLVDDICGTGATIVAVRKSLTELWNCNKVKVVTLCRNTGCSLVPDFYIWSVSDWVVFPWENIPSNIKTELLPVPEKVNKATKMEQSNGFPIF